ncbi:MAG: hypothetical protein AB7V13_17575 [Pseudorhodoplanes sp.]|uniref:hypothetical protein n=1 Tax=Pseudorhodoplanes sp. TaxID=1934341 RepID=UPI003D12C123
MTRLALTVALSAFVLGGMNAPVSAQRITDTVVGSCVFVRGAGHCVRQFRYGDRGNTGVQTLREPTAEEIAEMRERERRWVERCRPQLRPDAHGVNRYVYAARGCEYGRDRD